MPDRITFEEVLNSRDDGIYEVATKGPGPQGELPLSDEAIVRSPSGDIFGMSHGAGMGWDSPIALGFHTGHYELGLLAGAAAQQLQDLGYMPFAAFCTDPCDGRTQGTPGMMDSLAYRNDAATIFRRHIRSLPNAKGVLGVATCDKGLPAMMMALVTMHDLPCVLAPGGVTLPPAEGEDLAKVQSIAARLAHGQVTAQYAREMACRTCASAGGGCHFLGTAATSQVVAEALGLSLVHSALAPSGQAIWLDMAQRSAKALVRMYKNGLTTKDIITDSAVRNAMVVYAAFGGSTNLLLHIPAIAHAAGLRPPTIEDWKKVNKEVPRLVSVLPNGPVMHATVRAFLAGGVPEVMLQLRRLGLLELHALTVSGETLGSVLDWWQ
ncbi:MAG: dihydroxy-acid dehydratase domain-containing protein, partial [Planctomycetota bacterium]